jgi:enoyl-CoA hydratase
VSDLIVERANEIVSLTFNRPRVMNALTSEMIREVKRVLEEVGGDSSTRVVLFCGAGENFCAGADIGVEKHCTLTEYRTFVREIQDITTALRNLDAVAIAAIQGYCLGGGMEIACACDLRIAAEGARLGFPEVGLGLTITSGASQLLPALVGMGRAKELALLGDPVEAVEAYRIGLVNRVVPPEELLPEALRLAAKIQSRAPLAVATQKHLIDGSAASTLGTTLQYEVEAILTAFVSDDGQEGMSAFLDKRAPHFAGR